MPVTGPLQSLGTRVACIPIHRLGKDARMMSPKKADAIAECSPRPKHGCQLNDVPDMCVTRSAASSCQRSVSAFLEVCHTQAEEHVPQKAGDNKKVDVKMKTPEKCFDITKIKKTVSPIATDMCTVSLSRIAIPENNAVKVSEISACKDRSASAQTVGIDGGPSVFRTNQPVHANVTGDAARCDGGSQHDLQLLSLQPACIKYPSCEQNVFLGSFGLASKAELPQLYNTAGSRLHREVGGKLRRSVRPNKVTQMVYRRTNSMRCVSFEGNTDVSGTKLVSRSLHTSRESSPRSPHACNLSSDVSINKLSTVLLKRLKSSDIDKTANSGSSAETCDMETSGSTRGDSQQQDSSLSILADIAVADLEAIMMQDTKPVTSAQNVMKPSTAKPKVRSFYLKFSCH